MKDFILLFSSLFFFTFCYSQKISNKLVDYVGVNVGVSKHGTGDLRGYSVNCNFKKNIRKKASVLFGVDATVHDGELPITYTDVSGAPIDASYRYTTAGLQINARYALSFLSNSKNNLELRTGPLVRYQSSSYYDEIVVYYPPVSGLPFPVTSLINRSPQRTISVGGIAQVCYEYSISKNWVAGLLASMQIDSNGDVISQLGLGIGMKF
jgi:hypothetical protein